MKVDAMLMMMFSGSDIKMLLRTGGKAIMFFCLITFAPALGATNSLNQF